MYIHWLDNNSSCLQIYHRSDNQTRRTTDTPGFKAYFSAVSLTFDIVITNLDKN